MFDHLITKFTECDIAGDVARWRIAPNKYTAVQLSTIPRAYFLRAPTMCVCECVCVCVVCVCVRARHVDQRRAPTTDRVGNRVVLQWAFETRPVLAPDKTHIIATRLNAAPALLDRVKVVW